MALQSVRFSYRPGLSSPPFVNVPLSVSWDAAGKSGHDVSETWVAGAGVGPRPSPGQAMTGGVGATGRGGRGGRERQNVATEMNAATKAVAVRNERNELK
jgi:hypothetical protein